MIEQFMVEMSGVEQFMVGNIIIERFMVQEFIVKEFMVEKFMVEEFMVEISCNLFEQLVYPVLQIRQSMNFCPYTHQLF